MTGIHPTLWQILDLHGYNRAMTFDSVAKLLDLSAPHELWRENFDASSEFARQPQPEHMHDRAQWSMVCKQAGLSEEIIELLWQAAQECLNNPAMCRLLAHARYCFFEQNPPENPDAWPMLPNNCGQTGRLFYAIVFASEFPQALHIQQRRHIPVDITALTFSDLELWIYDYYKKTGQWGFNEHGWLIKHMRGNLFALGRLQFEICACPLKFHVWRHDQDGQILIFTDHGYDICENGLFASSDGCGNSKEIFTTQYIENNKLVIGNTVNKKGRIEKKISYLARDEWRKIMWPGAPALSVHIPARGRLDPAECEKSFQISRDFFNRYFSNQPFYGYWVESWLMDPQLTDYLPAESNIVQFQKMFRIVPFEHANDLQLHERVFGVDQFKPVEELPQNTRLQQIVTQHMKRGGSWRSMAGIKFFL